MCSRPFRNPAHVPVGLTLRRRPCTSAASFVILPSTAFSCGRENTEQMSMLQARVSGRCRVSCLGCAVSCGGAGCRQEQAGWMLQQSRIPSQQLAQPAPGPHALARPVHHGRHVQQQDVLSLGLPCNLQATAAGGRVGEGLGPGGMRSTAPRAKFSAQQFSLKACAALLQGAHVDTSRGLPIRLPTHLGHGHSKVAAVVLSLRAVAACSDCWLLHVLRPAALLLL